MAKYTVELRKIVESGIPIFDFAYPFYDESKRKEFEERFIKHFYFREIGCEAVERFKWFLEDKMNVVFPYYNELFKSASIEYDVLDNYKLTETYTRNVENTQKGGGVVSTVGRSVSEQETESKQNKTVDTVGTVDTTSNENTKGNASKDSSSDVKKKFLDTPQGLTDLSDSKYLTTLNHDTATGSETGNETKQTDSTSESESTGKETTADNIVGTVKDEQKTTQDSNTRNYSNGEQSETYTLTRRGNIGVDTDSDAIEKHNRLQKTLRNIEKMFFEECEDLFMLVY